MNLQYFNLILQSRQQSLRAYSPTTVYTVEDAHEKIVKLSRADSDIQETPHGLDDFSFHTGMKVNQSERRA